MLPGMNSHMDIQRLFSLMLARIHELATGMLQVA